MNAVVSPEEPRRLASLRALQLVDSGPDPALDYLIGLTAHHLRVPVVVFSVVEEELVHALGRLGLDRTTAPRPGSFSERVVQHGTFCEIADVAADRDVSSGPLLAAGLTSCAGAPVFSPDGQPIGSLCVLDTRSRTLTMGERHCLVQMAELATGLLHLRQARTRAAGSDGPRSDLRRALLTGELQPYYQPIVSMADGRTIQCEALARWRHPTHGLLTPAAFLDIAEDDGTLADLDLHMLERACRQVVQWSADPKLVDRPTLSINVSGHQLASRRFVDDIRKVLDTHGMAPASLTIEVTEATLGDAPDNAVTLLRRLRDLGASLAIDDFGASDAAPTYLQVFPINALKIHRMFVAGLGAGGRAETLLMSSIRLAKRLDLEVTAVGVETQAQADLLLTMGCVRAQGFLYGPAVGAEEFRQRLSH